MTSRVVGRGPSTLVGDTKPPPADNPVELVHLTGEDAETAEEPEDAPGNVVPMKRGRRPAAHRTSGPSCDDHQQITPGSVSEVQSAGDAVGGTATRFGATGISSSSTTKPGRFSGGFAKISSPGMPPRSRSPLAAVSMVPPSSAAVVSSPLLILFRRHTCDY